MAKDLASWQLACLLSDITIELRIIKIMAITSRKILYKNPDDFRIIELCILSFVL